MLEDTSGKSRPATPRAVKCLANVLVLSAATVITGCAGSSLQLADAAKPALSDSETKTAANVAVKTSTAASKQTLATIAKARKLRKAGQKTRALALLDKAAVAQPDDQLILKERAFRACLHSRPQPRNTGT